MNKLFLRNREPQDGRSLFTFTFPCLISSFSCSWSSQQGRKTCLTIPFFYEQTVKVIYILNSWSWIYSLICLEEMRDSAWHWFEEMMLRKWMPSSKHSQFKASDWSMTRLSYSFDIHPYRPSSHRVHPSFHSWWPTNFCIFASPKSQQLLCCLSLLYPTDCLMPTAPTFTPLSFRISWVFAECIMKRMLKNQVLGRRMWVTLKESLSRRVGVETCVACDIVTLVDSILNIERWWGNNFR